MSESLHFFCYDKVDPNAKTQNYLFVYLMKCCYLKIAKGEKYQISKVE